MIVLVIGVFIISSCSSPSLENKEWQIDTQAKKGRLAITHHQLGPLLLDIQLGIMENEGQVSVFTQWKAASHQNSLIISTSLPLQTEWIFSAKENALEIQCTNPNAVLLAKAPASESRIPARTENQDNGIMYTSLGFVSASDIHCLFDRATDILVNFPKGCRMERDPDEPVLMDISFFISDKALIELVPDYYINVLGLKYYKPQSARFSTAPVAWSSWYCYYMGTTEADMVTETDTLARHLMPYGLEYIQLDACYTRGEEANYLEWNKEAFPKGGKWLFNYIQSKGLKPALWVNIYGSNYAKAECAEKYPENFYLRDMKGELSSACCTADDTVVRLDYSNPEVIQKHLIPMFRTLVNEWGMTYIKDAGWGTWMDFYDRNRENAFDPSRTSRELYLEAQQALRGTLGPDVYIGGCAMHEVGLGFEIFDGSRTGGDDKAVWYPEKERGMSMQTYFHSLFGANYLNNITWHCDPDAAMVRNPLTYEEGQTIVSAMGLTGQLYMASDFMAKLTNNKMDLYRKTMPATRIVPIDLYPYKIESNKREDVVWCCPKVLEFPRAIDLKVNAAAGIYDVAAVFNWEDQPATKTISLKEDLGLQADLEHIVFNFWEQKLHSITKEAINVEIPAHGTRVFVIKPILESPQVITTSRHITGTISLKEVKWDATSRSLKGISKIIPGAPYSLFIHLPEGMTFTEINTEAEVMFHKTSENRILEVKFSGEKTGKDADLIPWNIFFNE